jgi:hypothetical protein
MTFNIWRRGSSNRPPLPVAIEKHGKARRVYVDEGDLKHWLRKYRPDLLKKWQKEASVLEYLREYRPDVLRAFREHTSTLRHQQAA